MQYENTYLMFIDFVWIPKALGGHSGEPWVGMRLSLRFQRYIREALDFQHDVECISLEYDQSTMRGRGHFKDFSSSSSLQKGLEGDRLIELLAGHRVFAVGRISDYV